MGNVILTHRAGKTSIGTHTALEDRLTPEAEADWEGIRTNFDSVVESRMNILETIPGQISNYSVCEWILYSRYPALSLQIRKRHITLI